MFMISMYDMYLYSLNNTLISKYSNFQYIGIVFDVNIKFNIIFIRILFLDVL